MDEEVELYLQVEIFLLFLLSAWLLCTARRRRSAFVILSVEP